MPYLISGEPYEETDDLTPQQRTIERRARRRAETAGYRFEKSRHRMLHMNNRGGWMLVQTHTNTCVVGCDYDIALVDLEFELQAQINRDLGRSAA